jgi:predicted dehydrogenase
VTQILHLPSLAQLQDRFEVIALCDVSASVREAVGKRWNVPRLYGAHEGLVGDPEVDVVLVANPNAFHAEVALSAIGARKHVLIEKPMCITLREADAIVAAQRASGVTVQVGYMRRYAPAFVEACRLLREVGEIRLARVHDVLGQNKHFIANTSVVNRADDLPEELRRETAKKDAALVEEAIGEAPPDVRRAYGLLLGLSSHDTSAMRELLGRPGRVLYAAQRNHGMCISAAFDYGDFVCQFETAIDDIPRADVAGAVEYAICQESAGAAECDGGEWPRRGGRACGAERMGRPLRVRVAGVVRQHHDWRLDQDIAAGCARGPGTVRRNGEVDA